MILSTLTLGEREGGGSIYGRGRGGALNLREGEVGALNLREGEGTGGRGLTGTWYYT